MTGPLTIWYCDICDNPIEDVQRGYLIWKLDSENKYHSFKIIHQGKCDDKSHSLSAALSEFLGPDGVIRLTAFLSLGPLIKGTRGCKIKNMDEYVDLFRRLQTPHYEEARRRFSNRDLLDEMADANEVLSYLPKTLCHIIEKYRAND